MDYATAMGGVVGAALGVAGLVGAIGLLPATVAMTSAGPAVRRLTRRRPNSKRSAHCGIHILNEEKEDPVADICFVHGLNGNSVSTWSSPSSKGGESFLWPNDLQRYVNARILVYDYSSVAPTAEYLSQRILYHQAEHLLEILADARKTSPRRPLIFVAHSLGGLLVKSALIFSKQSPEKNNHIRDIEVSTTGIIFLGTPSKVYSHMDSSAGTVLRNIAKYNGINRKVWRHLDNESKILQSHLDSFEALSTNIQMISFFELKKSPSYGILVPKSLAIHYPAHSTQSLDTNHAEISKFYGPDDPNYIKVRLNLQELCAEASSHPRESWQSEQKKAVEHLTKEKLLPTKIQFQLPPKSLTVIGREATLRWIEEAFLHECLAGCTQNCHTINLWGPGGIGKTEIAVEFAHTFSNRLSSIFWIQSDTPTSINKCFLGIALTLQLPILGDGDDFSTYQVTKSVLDRFENGFDGSWLLIFDNVDLSSISTIKYYIPKTSCHQGRVIITSRKQLTFPVAKSLEVRPLFMKHSKELLRTHLGSLQPYDSDLRVISEQLGCLPLALLLAARWLRITKMPPKQFLVNLSSSSVDGLENSTTETTGLNVILDECLKKISGSPAELLFSMCCMISMKAIPLWIFEESSKSFSSKRILRESICQLVELGLVTQNSSRNHISASRLIRDYGKENLPSIVLTDACRELCETASYAAIQPRETVAKYLTLGDEKDLSFQTELIDLTTDVLPIMISRRSSSMEWNVNLEELGDVCQNHEKFGDAKCFYELNLEKSKDSDTSMPKAKLKLALNRRNTGEDDLTNPQSGDERLGTLFQEAISVAMDDKTMEDIRFLNQQQNDPKQELQVLQMLIEAQEKRLGPLNLSTLSSMLESYQRLVDQGLLDEAEATLRRVLLSYQQLFSADHPTITQITQQLARICSSLQKFDEAERLYKEAIDVYEESLGRNHVSTQTCLGGLANVYFFIGRNDDAEKLFLESIDVLSQLARPNHPEVLSKQVMRGFNLMSLAKKGQREDLRCESRNLLKYVLLRMEAQRESCDMITRQIVAERLFRDIMEDTAIEEGDELWIMAMHLSKKYDLEQYLEPKLST